MSMAKWYQDDEGNISSMRILSVLIIVTYMSVWASLSIATMTLMPISFEGVMLISAPIAGKVGQKFLERK